MRALTVIKPHGKLVSPTFVSEEWNDFCCHTTWTVNGTVLNLYTYPDEVSNSHEWTAVSLEGYFNAIGTLTELGECLPHDYDTIINMINSHHYAVEANHPIVEKKGISDLVKTVVTDLNIFDLQFKVREDELIVIAGESRLEILKFAMYFRNKQASERHVIDEFKTLYPTATRNMTTIINSYGHNVHF